MEDELTRAASAAGGPSSPSAAPLSAPKEHPANDSSSNDNSNSDNPTPDTNDATNPNSSSESFYSNDSRTVSRSSSFTGSSSSLLDHDWDFTPLDKLTVFDVLDNLALPQRLEKINQTLNLKRHRDKVKEQYAKSKQKGIRKLDEEIERFKKRYTKGLDDLIAQWNDTRAVSAREKVSFVVGVSNIFITGFLAGGYPQWMHVWYSVQLIYFMPLRYYTYHQMGYHYFLADLCYFVNVLLLLSIWLFPNSRRLFISTYCLAYGNNAWAIAMWRNSLVFHSLDKVTSLFIHIMPPLVLHCLVHQLSPEYLLERFPAIHRVKTIEQYSLADMVLYATIPYALWQAAYHFLITVRRAAQIKAGRPTSFTWLRRSYANTFIGKLVLRLPNERAQEAAFMALQYAYALVTMLPCSAWFYRREASALFLALLGTWSVYNGATYYIDVFGTRFQRELEQLKRDVGRWQKEGALAPPPGNGESAVQSPVATPAGDGEEGEKGLASLEGKLREAAGEEAGEDGEKVDVGTTTTTTTRLEGGEKFNEQGGLRERNVVVETTSETS